MISRLNNKVALKWAKVGTEFLPIADMTGGDITLRRLLRLALFQMTVGMAAVLLIGTLNRVMIVELGLSASVVAVMIALPLVFAPLRAVIGFKSDNHKSVLGWKRVPYLWFGTLAQFGGLSIMPFSLILLSGDSPGGPPIVGQIGAALAFLLVGAGIHTTQTVGLALATDITPPKTHTKVVVLMCAMLLLGMIISSVTFGLLLANFSEFRLIQVIQGTAMVTLIVNTIALWKQEARDPSRTKGTSEKPSFGEAWKFFSQGGQARRRMATVALGTAAFSMEDVLLEPYGGQILHLPVAATTSLTALLAVGGLLGFAFAFRLLNRGGNPYRQAAFGVTAGLVAFSAVIFAEPFQSAILFGIGTTLIGFGAAQFEVGTLMATIALATADKTATARAGTTRIGLALGAWGAAQATAAGLAIASGGIIRDIVGYFAEKGALGEALANKATGYSVVYHLEILLLFCTLAALGPLLSNRRRAASVQPAPFQLAELTS